MWYSRSATCSAEEAGKCSTEGRLPAHSCSITMEEGDMGFVGQLTVCAVEVNKECIFLVVTLDFLSNSFCIGNI